MKKSLLFLNNRVPYTLVLLSIFSVVFFSCEEEEDDLIEDTSFDRTAMLTAYADDLIIPNFEKLKQSVDELHAAKESFTTEPNEANLSDLRAAWVNAVTDHQSCSAFGFGPGNLLLGAYGNVLGVFPVSETKIEENITNANFDLANSFSTDVRGFFAVEYLIYGNDTTSSAVVESFDQERLDYLTLVVNEIKTSIDGIVSEWNDSYRDEFIASNGTSAGSSTSLLYNEFVKDYENIKNFKVELPAGLTAGQTSANPKLVEAYYSGISKSLLKAHFESSKDIWYGRSKDDNDFKGFEEYLESVVGGPDLITTTKTSVDDIDSQLEGLPAGSLSEIVGSSEFQDLRDKLQANTANFKSSMSSLLGISITFNSGDGD